MPLPRIRACQIKSPVELLIGVHIQPQTTTLELRRTGTTVKSLEVAWQESVAWEYNSGAPMGISYRGYGEA